MIPMRTSSIFRSRWLALVWAAGIIWFAYDVAGGSDQPVNSAQATDATGAPITAEDAKRIEDALGGL